MKLLLVAVLLTRVFGSAIVHFTRGISVIGRTLLEKQFAVDLFSGIPYAQHQGRFRRPTQAIYPDGMVIDGTKIGRICPQFGHFNGPSEAQTILASLLDTDGAVPDESQCQSLDIYRPTLTGQKMRVVIYIHGGGLEVGARNQRFNSARRIHRLKMLRNDTVWINIGYSLGPLGFWHHTDENGQVHSNVALHEIILALKWVQDHIHQFGGDPENVTLVGYSGGAALAHLVHIILKDFHSYDFQFAPFIKLILMSGSALLFEPVFTEDALMRQAKIMSAAGCSDIACLKHLDPQQLVQAIVTAQVMCSPIIDNQLLFEKTELYLQSGHFFPGVTIMLTAAANECSPFCFIHEKKVTEIGHGLWSELGHDHLVESIQAHYQPQFASPLHSVTKAMSDAVFIGPARRIAKLYRQHGIMVYEHEFDFVLDRLNSPILNSIATTLNRFTSCSYVEAFLSFQKLGTFHGLDQAVLFDTAISKKGRWTVASLCSKEQAEVILSPVLKFICTGEAPNSVPLRVHGPPVDRVNVRKMVAHLYCRPQDE